MNWARADRIDRIRERTQLIWKKAGCPEDRVVQFWARAAREIDAENAASRQMAQARDITRDINGSGAIARPRGSAIAVPGQAAETSPASASRAA